MKIQRRFTNADAGPVGIETREDGSKMLVGYGAVFFNKRNKGTEYTLMPGVVERIAPQAFDRAIKESDDVLGLFNHDSNKLLGRVGSGTMRLSTDKKGLRYEIDLPDTTTGNDVAASVERGDLTGSSFSFMADKVTWSQEKTQEVRKIESVHIMDTGPVTNPAYKATTAGLRSSEDLEDIKEERAEWLKSLEPEKTFEYHRPGYML